MKINIHGTPALGLLITGVLLVAGCETAAGPRIVRIETVEKGITETYMGGLQQNARPTGSVTMAVQDYDYNGNAVQAYKGSMYEMNKAGEGEVPMLPPPERLKRIDLRVAAMATQQTALFKVPGPATIRGPEKTKTDARVKTVSIRLLPETAVEPSHKETVEKSAATPKQTTSSIQQAAAAPETHKPDTKMAVYFGGNRFRLGTQEKEQVKELIPRLRDATRGGLKIMLHGYTNGTADSKANNSRALRRAQAVAKYLEDNDVPVFAMKAGGKDMHLSEDEKLNRRVEILLVTDGKDGEDKKKDAKS